MNAWIDNWWGQKGHHLYVMFTSCVDRQLARLELSTLKKEIIPAKAVGILDIVLLSILVLHFTKSYNCKYVPPYKKIILSAVTADFSISSFLIFQKCSKSIFVLYI